MPLAPTRQQRFHVGVPSTQHRPHLRLVNVHEHGGFQDSYRALLTEPQRQGRRHDAYTLGYRHMVKAPTHIRPGCPCPSFNILPSGLYLANLSLSNLSLSDTLPQCHFMSMVWFKALAKYEYAFRVDEDVCLLRLPIHQFLAALSADYAFGLETVESHRESKRRAFSHTLAAMRPQLP